MRIEIQQFIGNNELVNVGKLTSMIIEGMNTDGWVHLYTKECISAYDIKLKDLLDSLVAYHKWDHSNITLAYANFKEHKTGLMEPYKVSALFPGEPASVNPHILRRKERLGGLNIIHKEWTKEKDFGLFIGRLNFTRLCALDRFNSFKWKHRGMSSMNQVPSDEEVNNDYILDFLKATNKRWSDIAHWQPYSEVGEVLKPPIGPHYNLFKWWHIYEKIGIEIVCETAESANVWSVSEKLVRPMMYKRPLLLIASPGMAREFADPDSFFNNEMRRVNPSWFKLHFFEHAIPLDYDNLSGLERVDAVFNILDDLITTGKINALHEDCEYDLRENYRHVELYLNQGFNEEGW